MMVFQPSPIPPEAVELAEAFFFMIGVIALGIPLIRAFTRRWERPALPPGNSDTDVTARLERIEQAVEAVAIEVERIAEAQRFSAKLMAGQPQQSLPPSDSVR